MTRPVKKRCHRCGELLGRENFNGSKRSKDGLAATCRACVNRRRRELSAQRQRDCQTKPVNLVDAARRGQLDVLKSHVDDNPARLQLLLWKTVQDFHSIKKTPAHCEQARWLIQQGATPHWAMVCEAARGGHQPLVDALLKNGIEINIFVAAATADVQALASLLAGDSRAASTDHDGVTPLHYCGMSALGKNHVERSRSVAECARRLIQAGADVNAPADLAGLCQLRPLHCVCWTGGNLELARLLLDRGADPAGCLTFALGHFQRHGAGHYDIAELLLETGIDIHEEGDEVLARFAAHEDAVGVRWLLEHGADPNVRTEEGRTPLHAAAERNVGNRVVKLLIEHGANVAAVTSDGLSPFEIATLNDKRAVATYLGEIEAIG